MSQVQNVIESSTAYTEKLCILKSEPITFFLRQAGSDTAGCQKKTTILLSCSGGAVVLSSLYSAIKAVYTLV